ncbi:Patatin-like phospholipase domain-containing protein 4 [Aphelenchoides fujianensis]|nr:Patatin-like phospholipase domain-containing protein 4 [Aphelenchoides fujianensis]
MTVPSDSSSASSKPPSAAPAAPIPASIAAPGTPANPAPAIDVATQTAEAAKKEKPEEPKAPVPPPTGLRGVSDPVSLHLASNLEGRLNALPKEVALSFSGCGFLGESRGFWSIDHVVAGTYHFGVMLAFQKNAKALLSRVTRFSGASAGSLIATLMVLAPEQLEDGLHQMYAMADELHRLPFGALSPGFYLAERLGMLVNRYLPEDVQKANGRLFISLTRQKDKTNRLVSEYADKPYIDGGYTNNLPIFEDMPTITVSPFSGSALIAPQDRNRFEWRMTLGSQQMKVNMQNIMRGAHSLFPPSSNVLHAYYEMGYRDGLKFLLTNGLLERGSGSEV